MTKIIETSTEQPVGASTAELDAIKARQCATWSSGDYGIIGRTLNIVGESLCEAVDLRAGSTVLDVAAGNGNCSLAAARRDPVPAVGEARAAGTGADAFRPPNHKTPDLWFRPVSIRS